MRDRILTGLATTLLAGGVALAQGTTGGYQGGGTSAPAGGGPSGMMMVAKEQVPYEATKHIAVVNAALVDATANATALKDITQDPRSYDPDHGRIFVSNIRTALTQAEAHLGHLQPLATSGMQMSRIKDIQGRLNHAKALVPAMESALNDPPTLGREAGDEANLTRGAIPPLKDVAQALNAKVTFKSIG
jgi:hypothetical protein